MQRSKWLASKWKRKIFRIAIVVITLVVGYKFIVLPNLLRWGATKEEYNRNLPGDELVVRKNYKNTLAVSVQATPSKIWPWVAQMGLEKGGFYSYTWLENWFGCKLDNADRIYPEWQQPQVGDYESVCQSAKDRNMPGWIVAIVVPNQSLVWKGAKEEWMMGVYIDSVDTHTSRLLTRMLYPSPKPFTITWWLDKALLEWVHCIMQQGMIQGIKKRVERKS